MENSKRTISRLFAVIAVGVTILLCGLLLGCYGRVCGEFVYPDSGVLLKAEMEVKDEYDIDDVSMDLIYGFDIDRLLTLVHDKMLNGNQNECGIYLVAFDSSVNRVISPDDYKNLYNIIVAIEDSRVKDGVYLIEEIPCGLTNGYIENDKVYYEDAFFIDVENFRSTEYEAIVNKKSNKVICNKKKTVNLPSELFVNKSGHIEIRMMVFRSIMYGEEQRVYIIDQNSAYAYNKRKPVYKPVAFDYVVEDGKVLLSNIELGEDCVIDGTTLGLQ